MGDIGFCIGTDEKNAFEDIHVWQADPKIRNDRNYIDYYGIDHACVINELSARIQSDGRRHNPGNFSQYIDPLDGRARISFLLFASRHSP
jgi:hypothetical protein